MFKYFILAAIFVLQVQAQGKLVQQLNSDEEIKQFISDNTYAVIEIKGKTKKKHLFRIGFPQCSICNASSNRITRSVSISSYQS